MRARFLPVLDDPSQLPDLKGVATLARFFLRNGARVVLGPRVRLPQGLQGAQAPLVVGELDEPAGAAGDAAEGRGCAARSGCTHSADGRLPAASLPGP